MFPIIKVSPISPLPLLPLFPSIPEEEEEPQSPPPGQGRVQDPPGIKQIRRNSRNAVLKRRCGKRDGDPKELFRDYWSRKKHKKFTKDSKQRIVALFIYFRNKGIPIEMIENILSNIKLDLEIK